MNRSAITPTDGHSAGAIPNASATTFAQGGDADAKDGDKDYNIYYCAGEPEVSQAALDGMKRDGVDAHSLAVDPMFVDPENGDFRFKPNSPALKLGIAPLDLSKVGLRNKED